MRFFVRRLALFVGLIIIVFIYYNIPQESHFVKGLSQKVIHSFLKSTNFASGKTALTRNNSGSHPTKTGLSSKTITPFIAHYIA
jgi:hypothetical protein